MICKLCGLTLVLVSTVCFAEQDIQAVGLFQDKALITIDGNLQKLVVGKTVDGITLVSSNSKQAVIKINGKTQVLKLGAAKIYPTLPKVEQAGLDTTQFMPEKNEAALTSSDSTGEVTIQKDRQGMIYTQASFNDNPPVKTLVDTGAPAVTISQKMADKMGLDYSTSKATSGFLWTSEMEHYPITLASVKVGNLELKNVAAMVISGEMNFALIGLTFLKRVTVIHNAKSVTLQAERIPE